MDADLLAQAILAECEVACPKERCAWTVIQSLIKGELQQLERHYLNECHFKADR